MKRYVLGFLFSDDGTDVLLVEKSRPTWQAGLLNGIGGSVESAEGAIQAITREATEELGESPEWTQFAHMQHKNWDCVCYRAFDSRILFAAPPKNDVGEQQHVYPITQALNHTATISNVPMLILLALDQGVRIESVLQKIYSVTIKYADE